MWLLSSVIIKSSNWKPPKRTTRRICRMHSSWSKGTFINYVCFVHPIFLFSGFWYFGHFSCVIFFPLFPSCPSCLTKCKQRLCIFSFSIFVTSYPKVTKNQKRKMRWKKQYSTNAWSGSAKYIQCEVWNQDKSITHDWWLIKNNENTSSWIH